MSFAADADADAWRFPVVKTVVGPYSSSSKSSKTQSPPAGYTYYGAFFYPFTKPGVDPVFAIVGGPETIIARPDSDKGIEIIQYFVDDTGLSTEDLCAACWTKDKETGHPLLAVGGPPIIKILDVIAGKVVQALSGHGDEIMAIIMSPLDQSLIASAGSDSTVRMWSLDPKHRSQPCALICAGEGHRESILTIAFHASGRYLLSGGMDHIVNLWVIPDLPEDSAGTDGPVTLMYPHFSTSMVHSNFIDCVAFHGDYILSKAAREGRIVLWAIQNFSSKVPPPGPDEAPTTHEWRDTRSAFGGSFERLMQFETPNTEPFFMHFGFFAQPYMHPILVMGTTTGKAHMWDLSMIEQYATGPAAAEGTGDQRRTTGTPSERAGSAVSTGVAGKGVKIKEDDVSALFGLIKPHHTLDIPKIKSTIRDIGFSPDGRYMVLVGEGSHITICRKW